MEKGTEATSAGTQRRTLNGRRDALATPLGLRTVALSPSPRHVPRRPFPITAGHLPVRLVRKKKPSSPTAMSAMPRHSATTTSATAKLPAVVLLVEVTSKLPSAHPRLLCIGRQKVSLAPAVERSRLQSGTGRF